MSKIRKFYVHAIPYTLNSGRSYIYDVNGVKCYLRPRLLKALKRPLVLDICRALAED